MKANGKEKISVMNSVKKSGSNAAQLKELKTIFDCCIHKITIKHPHTKSQFVQLVLKNVAFIV